MEMKENIHKILLCIVLLLSFINSSDITTDSNIHKPLVEEGLDHNVNQLPQIVVVQPVRRKGGSKSLLNQAPCGGLEKTLADTLSQVGKRINAIWEIRNPSPNGNCTVSISSAMDMDFIALTPKANNITYNEKDKSFACGRQMGFDYQEFELPENFACDHCTLQMKWDTPVGSIYQCSDMMILGNKIENCLSKCFNGGACVNGICVCKEGFEGEFCEVDKNKGSNLVWIILIILLFAIVVLIGYLLFKKSQDSWTKDSHDQYKKEFIENKKKETEIN